MKLVNIITGITLVLLTSIATAETDTKKEAAATKVNATSTTTFSYRPPMRGAPAARIGGGTRGVGNTTLVLAVLAPDHTGLTTKEQPTLYWYSSEAVPAKLEVTLINDKSIEPELEKVITTSGSAGIHRLDLTETGTKLDQGKEYRWFVSIIADPGQRSNDVVASGTIQRVATSDQLKKEIASADKQALAGIYARESIWYDTIDALTRTIEQSPGNAVLQKQRTALLEQVGLKDIAKFTRSQGR